MKITKAKELQKNFKKGLQIVGEKAGVLQWIGTDREWQAKRKPRLIDLYRNARSYDEYMEEALNYYDKEEADNHYHELNWKYSH